MLNGPVLAKDNDIGPNAAVKYQLLGARMDLFTVDANTGETGNAQQEGRRHFSLPETPILLCLFLQVSFVCVRGEI